MLNYSGIPNGTCSTALQHLGAKIEALEPEAVGRAPSETIRHIHALRAEGVASICMSHERAPLLS